MSDTLLTVLITSFTTILTALITAYVQVSIAKLQAGKGPQDQAGGSQTPAAVKPTRKGSFWVITVLLAVGVGAMAFLVASFLLKDSHQADYFQDFEDDNGTPSLYFQNAWQMPCDFSLDRVYEGKRAIVCQAEGYAKSNPKKNAGGTVEIDPASNAPVDLSQAEAISLRIFDNVGGHALQLVIWDKFDNRSNEVWSTMVAVKGKWTEISWPLLAFQGVDLSQVQYVEVYVREDGQYFFDAVEFR